ncbi:MAG: hypothetical protein GOVbin1753_67 [Prokaryotic dsDNA virus sp.]|nr:MAG: hypothetical protein GOVbin1753_67 [Prokaryotic dsDNA virus sp.]|tara:strand:- start:6397 stop:6639 length:243 start_codon:yes stop_codon:yes gene_type:complete
MSYEGGKYEYKFLVFNIINGPKNMIDNLNAEGDEGWEAYDNLSIGADKIVTFLRRKKIVKVIEPKEERERTLSSLWGGGD